MNLRVYEVWSRTKIHQRRVTRALSELKTASRFGKLVVSSSWGKDSCVLVDLAVRALGRVDVVHLQSPYELPGTEQIVKHFAQRCCIHLVPTRRTLQEYVDWLQEHGLGYERTRFADAGKHTKGDELSDWIARSGFTVRCTGVRADESKARKLGFRKRGSTYRLVSGVVCCNPLAWWTVRDTWAYLVSHRIPWHPLYDCETHGLTRETLRNAGWLTMHSANDGRAQWLAAHYPEQWRMLRQNFQQVNRLM